MAVLDQLVIELRANTDSVSASLSKVVNELASVGKEAQQGQQKVDAAASGMGKSLEKVGEAGKEAGKKLDEVGKAAERQKPKVDAAAAGIQKAVEAVGQKAIEAGKATDAIGQGMMRQRPPVEAAAAAMEKSLARVSQAGKKAAGDLDETANATGKLKTQTDQSSASVLGLASRFAGPLAAAFGAREFVAAANQMQSLQKRLEFVTGGATNAATSMALLKQIADEQHISIASLGDGFTRLVPLVKAGTLSFDEMVRLLRLTGDNVSAFGLGVSDVSGLLLGLTQSVGSGRVQIDDLRQVTDRIPGSMDAIAKAILGPNGTTGALYEMAQKGQLTVDVIKGGLIAAMAQSEGAAASMAGTFNASTADMKNAFTELSDTLAKAGIFDVLVTGMTAVTKLFQLADIGILTFRKDFRSMLDEFQAGSAVKSIAESLANGNTAIGLMSQAAGGGSYDKEGRFHLKEDQSLKYTGTTKEAEDTKGLAAAWAVYNGEAEKAKVNTDALKTTLNKQGGTVTALSGNAKDLKEKLDALEEASKHDKAQATMSDAAKAADEVREKVAAWTKEYGNLSDAQKHQVERIVENESATKNLTDAREKQAKADSDATRRAKELTEQLAKMLAASQHDLAQSQMSGIERAADKSHEKIQAVVAQYGELRTAAQKAMAAEIEAADAATAKNEKLKKDTEDYIKWRKDGAEKMARENERVAEAMNKPWEHAAEGIQNALTGALESPLERFLARSTSVAGAVERVFLKLATELATLELFGPQLGSLSVGGFARNAANSSASGGGLSSLLSGGSMLSGLTGKSLFGGAITGGVADLSTKLFGDKLLFGNLTDGLSFGSMGAGLVGGLAANKLFGGNKYGSMAGGLGGQLGGAALGTEFLTPALGALGGPAGALLGAFAGSALGGAIGGAFSGPRAHPASTFSTDGVFGSPLDLQSKHTTTEFAASLADSLKSALGTLMASGLNTSFIKSLQGGVDDGKGFLSTGDYSKWGKDTVGFDPANPDAGLAKFLKLVVDNAGDLSGIMDADLIPALKNLSTEGKTSAQVLQEIVSALTRDDLRKQFVASTQDSIIEMLTPGYAAMKQENERFSAALAQAKQLGLSQQQIAQVTLEHQLKVQALQKTNNAAQQEAIANATSLVQRYNSVSNGFGSLLDQLRNGKYTTLTPTANLADLRGQVLTAGQSARLGDADAQERLLTLLPQFLDLSAQVNGYNADFAKDQAMATDLAGAAKTVAERQLGIQQAILDQAQTQTGLLEKLTGGSVSGGNANDKLIAALKSGYGGLSNDQINAIFSNAGVTVAPGEGRRTGFLDDPANTGINSTLNSVFHALGVPGFAMGGWIKGGIAGADSVPTLHMPGEYTIRAASAAAIGGPSLDFMNRTGRMPANDNGEIAAMRQEIATLTRVTDATQRMVIERLDGIRASNASMAQAEQARATG